MQPEPVHNQTTYNLHMRFYARTNYNNLWSYRSKSSAKTNPQKGEMRGVDKYTECHTFIRPVVHIIQKGREFI